MSWLPFKECYASLLKPFIYFYWESLKLNKYEVVISSSHSFNSKVVKTNSSTLHIAYIHTPPRFLYGYLSKNKIIHHPLLRDLFLPLLASIKKIDLKAAQSVDVLVANSKETQSRIKNIYQKESVLIYPPLRNISKFKKNDSQYYICFSQLTDQKGIDLAINTCNRLHRKLIIIGTGPAEKKLRKIAGETVKFTGFIDDKAVSEIMQKATAMIYPSIEEDFGLSPVEALAHGVPVIAYRSGATPEYVIPNQTGLLFKDHSIESLQAAMLDFENKKWSTKTCQKFAQQFSEKKFHQQIKDLILKR